MTNLRTDEMAFFHSLMKIGTDENKAIYSIGGNAKVKRFRSFQIEGEEYHKF